jgi:P63C domain
MFYRDAYMPNSDDVSGRAKGGIARAGKLLPKQRSAIAKKAAVARWGAKATHKGNFQRDFGIDVECYVLDDAEKTAVISQRGMGEALGFAKEASGKQFLRSVNGAKIAPYLGDELIEKLDNPIKFQWGSAGTNQAFNGYDVTILIDVCKAIIQAEADKKLLKRQSNMANQAHIIVGASAKAGIRGLVYALAGYSPSTQEVIDAFKLYVLEEAKKYEPEFPSELYMHWHRLYEIPVPARGKPWHFKYLTVKHIYYPLAKSNGKLLALLKAVKAAEGDRAKKLFQFLNDIGARALRMQLGRVLEMAESSGNKNEYEAKIVERFGGQRELELLIPTSPTASPPPS